MQGRQDTSELQGPWKTKEAKVKTKQFSLAELTEFERDLDHISGPNLPPWLVDGAKSVAHDLREFLQIYAALDAAIRKE